MLSDFEQRMADVLGARLPIPWRGLVDVTPGRDEAQAVLSVRHSTPIEDYLLTRRPEVVPGSVTQRRILRLRCEVGIDVRRLPAQTRADQMEAFDRLIYELDDPEFRTGVILQPGDDSDPGFLLQHLFITSIDPPGSITLTVDGFFWPIGAIGETGVPIAQTRIRLSVQPLLLTPAQPRLPAGGAAVDLTLEFGATGVLRIESGDRVTSLPFGSVVVAVVDDGGRPGAGTLTGGIAGAAGARIVPVTSGRADFQYQPPAEAAKDLLVVALDNGEGGVGIELGRFPLKTIEA